jgi:hypothetical protein
MSHDRQAIIAEHGVGVPVGVNDSGLYTELHSKCRCHDRVLTNNPKATGGTQTSQGKGKHKDKQLFQAEVVQQNKEKPKVQDWGSSSASSGSTGQMQHHRGKH